MIDPITFDFETLQTFEQGELEVTNGSRIMNYGICILGVAAFAIGLKLFFDVLKNNPAAMHRVPENS